MVGVNVWLRATLYYFIELYLHIPRLPLDSVWSKMDVEKCLYSFAAIQTSRDKKKYIM